MNSTNNIRIRFLGASETVTGSKYLLEANGKKILVDCGLFQGTSALRALNWNALPVNAGEIDLVLITHAHLDHTGYLPRLGALGFRGEIWATAPTVDLTKIILLDSAHIQEEDANRANRENYSKHHPALPLYDLKNTQKTIGQLRPQPLNKWLNISQGISCRFRYNGHILGASFIELNVNGKIIVFSGDIGRPNDPLLYSPEKPDKADILLIESTYGHCLHPSGLDNRLAAIVNCAMNRKGPLIIPGFAVERAQMLLYLLHQLRLAKKIPNVPVYLDSPMGAGAMEVFSAYQNWHKLSSELCKKISAETRITRTIEDTRRIMDDPEQKIIVAGSGMVSGGRVLNYLARYIGDASATILLAGYQAEGTRGRLLLDGASKIKIFGKSFQVNALVENLEGISAHADQAELLEWLNALKQKPQKVFIVHGEKTGSETLRKKITEKYGFDCSIATTGLEYNFNA